MWEYTASFAGLLIVIMLHYYGIKETILSILDVLEVLLIVYTVGKYNLLSILFEDTMSIISSAILIALFCLFMIVGYYSIQTDENVVQGEKTKNIRVYVTAGTIGIFIVLLYIIAKFRMFEGIILPEGAAEEMAITAFFNAVLNDPLIVVTLSFGLIGLLATYAKSKSAQTVGQIMISWLPALFWVMVVMKIQPVPEELIDIVGSEGYAYVIYLIVYSVVVIGSISIMNTFKQIKE